jgi:hypothetical protein
MTGQRWLVSVAAFLGWSLILWSAAHTIRSAWGLAILAAWYVQGFFLFVNTIDLLWGRWIRPSAPRLPASTQILVVTQQVTLAPDPGSHTVILTRHERNA